MIRQTARPLFLFAAAAFLLMIPQKSFCGLHLEPYAGFGLVWNPSISGDFIGKIEEASGSSSSASEEAEPWLTNGRAYTRTAAGLRLGWSKLGFAAGLDLSGGYYHNGIQSQAPVEWFWTVSPGLFVSYKLPVLFRVYGALIPHGFLFSAGADSPCSNGESSDKCSPLPQNVKTNKPFIRSLKAGVSYISLPFVSLNIEYQPLYFAPAAAGPTGRSGAKGVLMHSVAAFLTVSL